MPKNWYPLAFINSKSVTGNSSIEENYQYADKNPLVDANYCRRKQIDHYGSFAYSKIVSVKIDGSVEINVSSKS